MELPFISSFRRQLPRCLLYLLFTTAVIPFKAAAQEPEPFIFRHVTEQTLPYAARVNDILSDSKGFVWLSSSSGLIKWYGTGYQRYVHESDNSNSLPTNSLINVLEAPDGDLWIGSMEGLVHMDRATETFTHYKTGITGSGPEYIEPFHIDSAGRVWCSCPAMADRGTIRIFDKRHPDRSFIPASPRALFTIHGRCSPGDPGRNPLYYLGPNGGRPGISIFPISEDMLQEGHHMFDGDGFPTAFIDNRITIEDAAHVWLSADIGMIALNPQNNAYTLFDRMDKQPIGAVRHVFVLSERYLLVSTEAQGVWLFDKRRKIFTKAYRHIPGDPECVAANRAEKMVRTKDGQVIIAVPGSGLELIKPEGQPYFKLFPKSEAIASGLSNSIKFMCVIDAHLIWGVNTNNRIAAIDTRSGGLVNDKLVQRLNKRIGGGNIGAILRTPDGLVWVAWDKHLIAISLLSGTIVNYDKYLQHIALPDGNAAREIASGITCLTAPLPGKLLMGDRSALYDIFYDKTSFHIARIGAFDALGSVAAGMIYHAPQDVKCLVLAEGGGRPVVIDYQHGRPVIGAAPWAPAKINDVLPYNGRDTVLLCTEEGLFLFDLTRGDFIRTGKDPRLSGEILSGSVQNGYYWLATPEGLLSVHSRNFTVNRFLPNSGGGMQPFVKNCALLLTSGAVLFGGDNGIVSIPAPSRKEQAAILPPVFISELLVNEQPYTGIPDRLTEVVLPKDSNTIAIRYNIVSFEDQLPEMEYRLKGIDPDWVANKTGQVRYVNLPQGSYAFEIRQKDNKRQVKRLLVVIRPGWYETWWFYSALLLGLVSIAAILIRQRIHAIRQRNLARKKEAELRHAQMAFDKRIAESEMAALKSQMNPHFIFNVLNSINSYILSNRKQEASKFLTDFSRLIRLVLENSHTAKVSLEKDVEALQLYIDMEKLRFTGRFEYTLQVSPEIDTLYTQVPPLLVQPYVENAIWHGLMHKDDPGNLLSVVFTMPDENLLQVEITDNGVGRAAADSYKSKSATRRKSFGMQITKDRIAIINQLYQMDARVNIEDLVDDRGVPGGTRVTLIIPI
jgi:hypothetical protein